MKPYTPIHESIAVSGYQFRVVIESDDSSAVPWDNDCIYDGVVSGWQRTSSKRPHERILCEDRGSVRLFDVRQFIAVAKSHGCTAKQAAEQLEPAFEYLRRWCDDQWHYVGVIVQLLDDEGEPVPGEYDSIWGIESDCCAYINETALDMAQCMAGRLHNETVERGHWAARDVATV